MPSGPNSGSPNSASGRAVGRWRVPRDDWTLGANHVSRAPESGWPIPLLLISGLATGPPAGVGDGLRFLPMNSRAWCVVCGDCAEAVSGSSVGRRPQSPLTPGIANRCRRIWFLSVVHDHRPVARWRPPRSTLLLRGQRTELEA